MALFGGGPETAAIGKDKTRNTATATNNFFMGESSCRNGIWPESVATKARGVIGDPGVNLGLLYTTIKAYMSRYWFVNLIF
jgi:hypothetical protein